MKSQQSFTIVLTTLIILSLIGSPLTGAMAMNQNSPEIPATNPDPSSIEPQWFTIDADAQLPDPVNIPPESPSFDDPDQAPIAINCIVDAELNVDKTIAHAGDVLTYTIVIINSEMNAYEIRATLLVPDGTAFVDGSANPT